MTYNQKRHRQLLKRSQDLKNQRKNLFIENQEEDFELSEYNIAVEEHIFWQERYNLALSIADFLNGKIDGEELCNIVYGLRNKLRKRVKKFQVDLISEKIKDFQPEEGSNELSGFLTGCFCCCEDFMENYENEEFYTSIKNGFLNLQKVLDED